MFFFEATFIVRSRLKDMDARVRVLFETLMIRQSHLSPHEKRSRVEDDFFGMLARHGRGKRRAKRWNYVKRLDQDQESDAPNIDDGSLSTRCLADCIDGQGRRGVLSINDCCVSININIKIQACHCKFRGSCTESPWLGK